MVLHQAKQTDRILLAFHRGDLQGHAWKRVSEGIGGGSGDDDRARCSRSRWVRCSFRRISRRSLRSSRAKGNRKSSLLGFQLLPRRKAIGSQKLYRPDTGEPLPIKTCNLFCPNPLIGS